MRTFATGSIAACSLACALWAIPLQTLAQSEPAPAPVPSPSATPSGPVDPCGSILSIVTRPTVTTSVCTVRPAHALLETGYTNTITTGPGGGNAAAYPQALVRIGAVPRVEVAFAPPSFNRSSVGGPIASGSSDMNFGAKWEIGYSAKALWGINAQISAPTGDPGFTAGGTEYTGNINWGYALSSIWGLAGTFGFNALAGLDSQGQVEHFASFIPSIEATAALPQSSQAFLEYAYFSHAGVGLGGKSLVDFGYVRDFGAHVQGDIEYGFSPTVLNGQRQHYFGFGLSLMN